jgi:glycosyltransferase involved in cell wall biosynthesis
MLKPAWPVFARHVRRWIETAALTTGQSFDIAHQLMPQAARYASPLRHFDVPYVIGPLGGALDTPEAFRDEVVSAPIFTRLRALDSYRFRHDPWLRQSYSRAACVLGVAPYVKEVLGDLPLRRFESVLELGADDVAPPRARPVEPGKLRVLHVGRAVRTKGLRDTVRALAHLSDLPGITLTSAGTGEDLDPCRAEAARLGVADRVRFLGRIPRDEVEALYESHDVFCFPSFREPAGGVLYEAMRHGLPVSPPTAAVRAGSWTTPAASGAGHRPRHLRRRHRRALRGWPHRRACARRLGTARAPRCGVRGFGRQRPTSWSISTRILRATGMRGTPIRRDRSAVRNSLPLAFCAVTSISY